MPAAAQHPGFGVAPIRNQKVNVTGDSLVDYRLEGAEKLRRGIGKWIAVQRC
jgi:hypothetical protein